MVRIIAPSKIRQLRLQPGNLLNRAEFRTDYSGFILPTGMTLPSGVKFTGTILPAPALCLLIILIDCRTQFMSGFVMPASSEIVILPTGVVLGSNYSPNLL